MKKIDEVFYDIDKKVDLKVVPIWKHVRKYFPVFSISLLTLLIGFYLWDMFYNRRYFSVTIMKSEISSIVESLAKIDRDCSILSIENEKNYVDFLNVIKFSGSEVGCLNLAYPNKWQGPYLNDNPTYQGKLYQIVKTKFGVFVVPGDGVVLPNGFKIGEDFKIDYQADISKMLKSGGLLNYKNEPLGMKLDFEIGDWGREELRKIKLEQISKDLKEFNEAISFSHNDTIPYKC